MNAVKPKKAETEVISIRIPSDLLQGIDRRAAEAGLNRNEFLNRCFTFALNHLEIVTNEPRK